MRCSHAFFIFYWDGDAPRDALQKAVAFAGYKVGEQSASPDFLSERELLRIVNSIPSPPQSRPPGGSLPGRQSEKFVRSNFDQEKAGIILSLRLVKLNLSAVILTSLQDLKIPNFCRLIRLQKIGLPFPTQHFLTRILSWIET